MTSNVVDRQQRTDKNQENQVERIEKHQDKSKTKQDIKESGHVYHVIVSLVCSMKRKSTMRITYNLPVIGVLAVTPVAWPELDKLLPQQFLSK